MKDTSLEQQTINGTGQTAQELEASRHEHELLLPQSDRIVVFGSRGSGASDLAGSIQEALISNDIPEDEARVDWTRYANGIEETFFANHPEHPAADEVAPPEHPALAVPQAAKRGLMQRIRQLFSNPATPDLSPSTEVALPAEPSQPEDPFQNTRPRGVLIFPEMRQYWYGNGMTVPTDTERIIALCEANNVPWVRVEKIEGDDNSDIQQAVTTLLELASSAEQPLPRPIKRDAAAIAVEKSLREHMIRERVLADFDGEAPDAIFPLSGGIIQRKDGRWETTGSSDPADHGLVTIGRARVIAGAEIAKLFPESAIVANSYNRFNPDEPTMASVVHDELRRRGIPEDQIILEEESFSTITQYVEMVKLAVEKKWTKLTILINEYYTPRATALFEHLDTIVQDDEFQRTLQEFKDMGAEVAFIESDEILGMMSEHFTHHLDEVKQTPAYQETVAKEAQGLRDLLDGKYKVRLTPEKPRH